MEYRVTQNKHCEFIQCMERAVLYCVCFLVMKINAGGALSVLFEAFFSQKLIGFKTFYPLVSFILFKVTDAKKKIPKKKMYCSFSFFSQRIFAFNVLYMFCGADFCQCLDTLT